MRSPYGRRFTLREAAAFLEISQDALRTKVRRGTIVAHRDGTGPFFFYERELLQWIEQTRIGAPVASVATAPASPGPDMAAIELARLMPAVRELA